MVLRVLWIYTASIYRSLVCQALGQILYLQYLS